MKKLNTRFNSRINWKRKNEMIRKLIISIIHSLRLNPSTITDNVITFENRPKYSFINENEVIVKNSVMKDKKNKDKDIASFLDLNDYYLNNYQTSYEEVRFDVGDENDWNEYLKNRFNYLEKFMIVPTEENKIREFNKWKEEVKNEFFQYDITNDNYPKRYSSIFKIIIRMFDDMQDLMIKQNEKYNQQVQCLEQIIDENGNKTKIEVVKEISLREAIVKVNEKIGNVFLTFNRDEVVNDEEKNSTKKVKSKSKDKKNSNENLNKNIKKLKEEIKILNYKLKSSKNETSKLKFQIMKEENEKLIKQLEEDIENRIKANDGWNYENYIVEYQNHMKNFVNKNGKEQLKAYKDNFKYIETLTDENEKNELLKKQSILLEKIEQEEENFSRKFINKYWKKKYYKKEIDENGKEIEIIDETKTEAFKNRKIESAKKYGALTRELSRLKELESFTYQRVTTPSHTMMQELIFKPTTNGEIELSTEELINLKKLVENEEREKGNIVLFSTIHNDESKPHIHLFIVARNFDLQQNQVQFINQKYNKNFDLVKRNRVESSEYGVLTQNHLLEQLNECLIDKTRNKFVFRYEKNIKDNNEELEKINKMDKEEQISYLNEKINEQKIYNRKIAKRKGERVDKREFNNSNFRKELEKNEKLKNENLSLLKEINNLTNQKNDIEEKILNYQKDLEKIVQEYIKDFEFKMEQVELKVQSPLNKLKQMEDEYQRIVNSAVFRLDNLYKINTGIDNNGNVVSQEEQIKRLEEYFNTDKNNLENLINTYVNKNFKTHEQQKEISISNLKTASKRNTPIIRIKEEPTQEELKSNQTKSSLKYKY